MSIHVSAVSVISLKGRFALMEKCFLIIWTYNIDFVFQICGRLADVFFHSHSKSVALHTSPSKISPSHYPPCRKWEKMPLLDLAVRRHFSPEPADSEVWALGNIRTLRHILCSVSMRGSQIPQSFKGIVGAKIGWFCGTFFFLKKKSHDFIF